MQRYKILYENEEETMQVSSFCDSGGIQTHNLLIRSQMLYSVELRNLRSRFAVAKVRTFSQLTKFFGNFFSKKFNFPRFSL